MPDAPSAEDLDARAERYAYLAAELAGRVQSPEADEPAVTARWIAKQVTAAEWPAFALILAGMVPVDQTPAELLAWAVDRMPVDERPSWRWRPHHNTFTQLRSKGCSMAEIPLEVRDGEQLYQAANRRERTPGRLAAAS